MILEFGNENRFPFAPAASKNAPMLAAIPVQRVETSGLMKFMVSNIANPALTDPPGELI